MLPKKPEKWERAVPIKRPDNIISSDYTEVVPFKPFYERSKEPVSMFSLLSMDYARQWHLETKKRKEVVVVSNERAFLQRRYVIRGLLKRMQKGHQDEKRFIMKKFRNIPSRYKNQEEKGKTIAKKVEKDIKPSDESVSVVTPCSDHTNLLEVWSEKRVIVTNVEKTHKFISNTVEEDIEPSGESVSVVSPCSEHTNLLEL